MAKIICPNVNCGYRGRPKYRSRGSLLLGCFLLLLGILPGVLYFMFFSGYRRFCPQCGCEIT